MIIEQIEIGLIQPNDYNPNNVDQSTMTLLKDFIEREGFLQPIIIKKDPVNEGKYLIVDGEHRFLVMKELGHETIPSIVVEKDDDMAKVLTVTMNKFRGSFDTIKLASVLADLRKSYSDDELSKLLGFRKEELDAMQDIADFEEKDLDYMIDNEKAVKEAVKASTESDDKIDFSVELSLQEKNIVMNALDKFGGTMEAALVGVIRQTLS